ncbi:hypothetical protein BGX27_009594 [Mortierella sp. AM989]|nr:hypothetical protein BGX27_009594 [Mortierella sp. AM989]
MYLRSQLPFQPNSFFAGFLPDRLSNRSNRIKHFPEKSSNTSSEKNSTGKERTEKSSNTSSEKTSTGKEPMEKSSNTSSEKTPTGKESTEEIPILDEYMEERPESHEYMNNSPESDEDTDEDTEDDEYMHEIYVAPFPNLSTYSKNRLKIQSGFTTIAGTHLLNNEAIKATLRFKWYKFGRVRWAARFFVVLVFSILYIVITAVQIKSNNTINKNLANWDTAIYTVIGLGSLCLLYEFWQFCLDWKRYYKTLYNYLDLLAFTLSIIGCFRLLSDPHGANNDESPVHNWWISFSLLAVYLNILFELKVFRPLGTVVHMILNIAQKVRWFLAIFVTTMVAFTHAFMYFTHTKPDPCVNLTDEAVLADCEATKTQYPEKPLPALFSTFFFLAGFYDPIGNDLNDNTSSDSVYGFNFLLTLFIFFTVILLMNVLIAIMNDAYSESRDEGQSAWLKQWSQVVAEAEIFLMQGSTRMKNRDYFPNYIYYGASTQDEDQHKNNVKKGSVPPATETK